MNILFEDRHILVCEKPAGIPTQAGKITEKDMLSEVNNYMRKAGDKSPAYLIHRLDKPVRGILVFAKTKQAAAGLNKQITEASDVNENFLNTQNANTYLQNNQKTDIKARTNVKISEQKNRELTGNTFEKRYYAIVEGLFDVKSGVMTNYICKDGNKAYIDDSHENKDAKRAVLEYEVIEEKDVIKDNNPTHICKLDIKLHTGRFHQIRCQLANACHPIVGDTLYGSTIQYEKRKAIGLIAYSLSFVHPITKKKMHFEITD